MSSEILRELRDDHAFKPKPPDHELARAHVFVADIGIPHAIDDKVIAAMSNAGDALTLIIGPPGSGKSSLFAAATNVVTGDLDRTPIPLPLKVPVAHHAEPLTPELLVRGITQSLAYTLGPELPQEDRQKLEHSLATTIASAHQSPGLTAGVTGGPAWLRGNVGVDLGRDLVTATSRPEWQGGGPILALASLQQLASARGLDLIVMFDDTDVWSVGDASMADRARSFFLALRVLQDCPDVTMLVAVQSHWTEQTEGTPPATTAARREYQELAERVDSTLTVPRPETSSQAEALMTAIIERRVEIALPQRLVPAIGWAHALFASDALDLLANRCLTNSIRRAIGDIRDAFDHLGEMPDRISSEELLEVIDE